MPTDTDTDVHFQRTTYTHIPLPYTHKSSGRTMMRGIQVSTQGNTRPRGLLSTSVGKYPTGHKTQIIQIHQRDSPDLESLLRGNRSLTTGSLLLNRADTGRYRLSTYSNFQSLNRNDTLHLHYTCKQEGIAPRSKHRSISVPSASCCHIHSASRRRDKSRVPRRS